ncbi:diacylglycerol kinase family lipid kinase [candidate division WOR-3 bacterium]|nr:diacylglycerol kinase family lipid kinase [candidate division WOR-3 bacterium]
MKKELHIIVNPAANRGKPKPMFRRLEKLLKHREISYSYYFTEFPGHATQLADRVISRGVENLIVFGGDGTYNEVVNGCFGKNVKLGLIPAGSCNDFIKEIGPWQGLNSFLDSIEADNTILIDAGRMNNRIFLNNIGVGFDAQVINDMIKRNLKTNLGYVLMVLKNLFEFDNFKAHISSTKESADYELMMLTINNGTTYGGGFKIAPEADIHDGLLDVCLIGYMNRVKFILNFSKVYSGTHLEIDGVSYWKTEKVNVEFDRGLPVQVDGELLPEEINSIEVEILPEAFKVYKFG